MKTLVIIFSETRTSELTFENIKKNVIDELNADVCVCIGTKPDYDTNNPFFKIAKYRFLYPEPEDFGDAFEEEYKELIEKNNNIYEKIENVNTLYGRITPEINCDNKPENNIHYLGHYDTNDFNFNLIENENKNKYDEIVFHTKKTPEIGEEYYGSVYGIQKTYNNFKTQEGVNTYRKRLYWREFLKVKDQFLGGIKDEHNQHLGSAGILIFFRWFLLKQLIQHNLIEKYDRFIITRSDYLYRLPHPRLELMNPNYIWIPDEEHYGGFTDRHVVLSKTNITNYLNIFEKMVIKSNDYFMKMININSWNLEKFIKFHLIQEGVEHLVREFPYIMYSVRNINGSTRWTKGVFSEKYNYFIKYMTEYNKSNYYKKLHENSGLTINDFYMKILHR